MRITNATPVASPTATATPAAARPEVTATADTLRDDPTLARALLAAWSGDPIVVVASPPGAGKTRLITRLARELSGRAGLSVAVAAQTRAQSVDVASRAAAEGARTVLVGASSSHRPRNLHPDAAYLSSSSSGLRTRKGVVVATTARWKWTSPADFRADVLLVDEAWQATFADLGTLGVLADQVVLVGDPGQISPVVTGDTSRWDSWDSGPHKPAPEAVIAAYPDDVVRLRLPSTWRLGPDTTSLIQPLFYPNLPFDSRRPPRALIRNGQPLPELAVQHITPATPEDPTIAQAAAATVRDLLSGTRLHDNGTATALGPDQIAVVTPHLAQAALITAHLADLPDVLIGTANSCQGLERDAVVVVHPLCGYRAAETFALDPGRMCVSLSRHRAHATVIIDTQTRNALHRARGDHGDSGTLALHERLLTALTEQPSGTR